MENHRVINIGSSNKKSNSPNGISTAERDQAPAVPSSESQETTHVISSTNGFINHSSPNAIRPPLPPPHLPLPPTGALPTISITQSSSTTTGLGASTRSSGARSSSRSSHHRSGKKGTTSGLSPRSKSSGSSGSALRPKACRLCGQPHSYHEPHLYNYRYLRIQKLT
jgi:hypothetical protein